MAVPNTFVAGSVISASALNENFSYQDARTSSLTQDNFSAATRIPNANLANPNTVIVAPIHIGASGWVATSGEANGFVALPYDSTEGAASYTIIAANAHWRNASAVSPSNVSLQWGFFQASGTGTSAFTALTQVAIFNVTSTAAGTWAGTTISGLPVTVTTSASRAAGFAVRAETAGTGFNSNGDQMVVSLKLIRALRG